MITLADIFESLDPIMAVVSAITIIGTYFAATGPKLFFKVVAFILLGTILLCFLMVVLGSAFNYLHPSLTGVGVFAALPILGYIVWKIGPKMFSEKDDNQKGN